LKNERSDFDAAPRNVSLRAAHFTIRINPDKIREVIGKGGATIRSITEETKTSIDITDDGVIKIASVDYAAGQEARRRIEEITAEVEVGKIYEGKIVKLMDFGAFVTILPGRDGLVHIRRFRANVLRMLVTSSKKARLSKSKFLRLTSKVAFV